MTTPSRPQLVSAYGASAPSTRVRLLDWMRHLGIEADVHSYAGLPNNRPAVLARHLMRVVGAERRLRRLPQALAGSRVVLSREAGPIGSGRTERALLTSAGHGVYDFDDALFADNAGWRKHLGRADRWRQAVAAADHVMAGNDHLADVASDHARAVTVVPSCVEIDDYPVKQHYAVAGRPSLVWVGSSSTEAHVVSIAPALREVARRTDAVLTLVSVPRDVESPALAGLVRRVPWSPQAAGQAMSEADVAIGPLVDTPYARGKCAYKLLQYAACGLPTVASPVGANAAALSRLAGREATTLDDWIEQLCDALAEPVEARRARGHAARTGVQSHYSFSAWRDTWSRVVGV